LLTKSDCNLPVQRRTFFVVKQRTVSAVFRRHSSDRNGGSETTKSNEPLSSSGNDRGSL